MDDTWKPPEGHPIDEARARAQMSGGLGDVLRQVVMDCCRPIYWFAFDDDQNPVLHNGTVTLIQTPNRLLGVTARHAVEDFKKDHAERRVRLQIADAVINDLPDRIIATSEELDLATIDIDQRIISQLGAPVPLRSWPPMPPERGSSIMFGGFPGQERQEIARLNICFGLSTGIGIAQNVSDDQITWIRPEAEYIVEARDIPIAPPNYEQGGVSGGPLIAGFETPGHFFHYRLAGIIVEARADYDYVIAKRADFIEADGRLQRPISNTVARERLTKKT
jgi:hypothetical protein